jgi:hypothetical protein
LALAKKAAEEMQAPDSKGQADATNKNETTPPSDPQKVVIKIQDNRAPVSPFMGSQVLNLGDIASMKGDELKPLSAQPGSKDAPTPDTKTSQSVDAASGGEHQDLKDAAPAKDTAEGEDANPVARRSRAKIDGVTLADGGPGQNNTEDSQDIPPDGVVHSLVALGGAPVGKALVSAKKVSDADPTLLTEAEKEVLRRRGGLWIHGVAGREIAHVLRAFGATNSFVELADGVSIPWMRILWVISICINGGLLTFKILPLLRHRRARGAASISLPIAKRQH